MKRIALCFCVLMILSALDAAAETQTLNFANFDEISVGSGMHLSVTQGTAYQVTATGSSGDLQRLDVKRNGSRLEFSIRSGPTSFFRSGPISLDITLPALHRLDLSGGSEGRVSMQTASQSFAANLSGGSVLNGSLNTADIDLNLSGGSRTTLSGSGQDLNLAGSGGSKYTLKDLAVNNASIALSGGSNATVTLRGKVDSNLSGGSEVIYYGNAALGDINASGGSRIRKGS